jgi:hypothetical protein
MYLRLDESTVAAALLLFLGTSTLAAPIDATALDNTGRFLIDYSDLAATCFPANLTSPIDRRNYWIRHIEDECFAKAIQGSMSDLQSTVKARIRNHKIMPHPFTGTIGNFSSWEHSGNLDIPPRNRTVAEKFSKEVEDAMGEAQIWIELILRIIKDLRLDKSPYDDGQPPEPRPTMLKKGIYKRDEPQTSETSDKPDQKEAAGKPIDGFHVTNKVLEGSKKKTAHVKGTARERSCAHPLFEKRDDNKWYAIESALGMVRSILVDIPRAERGRRDVTC